MVVRSWEIWVWNVGGGFDWGSVWSGNLGIRSVKVFCW